MYNTNNVKVIELMFEWYEWSKKLVSNAVIVISAPPDFPHILVLNGPRFDWNCQGMLSIERQWNGEQRSSAVYFLAHASPKIKGRRN